MCPKSDINLNFGLYYPLGLTAVFSAWVYGRFTEIQTNFRRKKLHRTNQNKKPVKNLGYINYYSLSSQRPYKSPRNFIRYNCHKICSWLKRPSHTGSLKKGLISVGDQQVNYLQVFSKTLLTTERRLSPIP